MVDEELWNLSCTFHTLLIRILHYGLKLSIYKILNFPLESPSQIAPKVYFFVEQCRTEIQTQVEVGYAWEGFHVIICLQ